MSSLKILIADDCPDMVDSLSTRCEALGLDVITACDGLTTLEKAEEQEPDLILLGVDLPHGDGLSVCHSLAGIGDLGSIPVIILTRSASEETIHRCHELCAYYVLKSPDVWSGVEPVLIELLDLKDRTGRPAPESEVDVASPTQSDALVDAVFAVIGVEGETALSESDTQLSLDEQADQPWVLSIEDDDDVALALRLRLEAYGVNLVRASAGTEGYRKAFFSAPNAILLDYELPEGNGDYVLRRLKETPLTADVPVIVLTGRRDLVVERKMRALGAAEFLTKPFNWDRLREALDPHLQAAAAPV